MSIDFDASNVTASWHLYPIYVYAQHAVNIIEDIGIEEMGGVKGLAPNINKVSDGKFSFNGRFYMDNSTIIMCM